VAAVALHDLGPSDPQLAGLSGRDVPAGAGVGQAGLGAGGQPADGSWLPGAAQARRPADHGGGLGHPVALPGQRAQALAGGHLHRRGHVGAGGGEQLQAGGVVALDPLVAGELGEDGQGNVRVGDPVGGDKLQHPPAVRDGESDDGCANAQRHAQ
jgi:hypothetical protein